MSDLFRRDPRRERIQRNRLHPLYQAPDPFFSASAVSDSRLVRKNPHLRGFIGPNGIRRIDRLDIDRLEASQFDIEGVNGVSSTPSSSVIQASSRLPLHYVAEPAFYIVVVAEMRSGRLTSADKDMLGLAQQLANGTRRQGTLSSQRSKGSQSGGAVLAVVFTPIKDDSFTEAGIDRLLDLSSVVDEGYHPEYQLALLQQVDQQFAPRYWLFGDQTLNSADLGRRLAASLDERAATGVVEIDDDSVWCQAGHSGKEYRRPHERILLVAEQIADPVTKHRYQASPVELDTLPKVHPKIDDLGLIAVDPRTVPLAEAEFVVAGGNGVTDWALFHQAAAALGATEGASRVAVDDGNMPRATQVGASGTWISARVYLAVGISGAIQHMQGMTHCDTVIAINLDPGCAMVSRADLSVIGDSSEIMLALLACIGDNSGESIFDDSLAGLRQNQAKEVWDDAV